MRWESKPAVVIGKERTKIKFAWFPTRVALIEDTKQTYINIWLEKYYQDQEYNWYNCEFKGWINIGIGYIYRNRKVV